MRESYAKNVAMYIELIMMWPDLYQATMHCIDNKQLIYNVGNKKI